MPLPLSPLHPGLSHTRASSPESQDARDACLGSGPGRPEPPEIPG